MHQLRGWFNLDSVDFFKWIINEIYIDEWIFLLYY